MSEAEGANSVKGVDLGWNDPPMFSFDSRQVYNNAKKPTLTKRVGLSWDSSTPSPSCARTDESVLPASAPPRAPVPGPPPPSMPSKLPDVFSPRPSAPPMEDEPQTNSTVSASGTVEADENVTPRPNEINLDSVYKSLSELAEELFGDKEREKAEISKRLSIMDSLWQEDKFPVDLKEKLHKISEALEKEDVDEADKLQRGLMIDHSALCSTWMAAIRKLISVRRQDPSS